MMNRKLAVSAALALGMSFAGATYAATPFEGFYVGGQVGYSVYDNKLTLTNTETIDGLSGRGADGGLYAGWGTLIDPAWYAGVEGEYNWADSEHTTSGVITGSAESLGFKDKDNWGLSARFGWLPSKNVMLYTRLGWQEASIDYSASGVPTMNQHHNGFRLGFGTEVAMTSNWLVRLDYNHTWYGKETVTPGVEAEPNNDLFRVGVAYQF